MGYTRDTINDAFAKVLKGVMRENGQTQQSVADHLGQNVATVNRILGGKRDITVTQFVSIVDLCGEDPKLIVDRVWGKLHLMSAVPDNVVPLTSKRPAEMSDSEIEGLRGAANDDIENERDEPDAP